MKDWASRNPSSLVREICELGRSQLAPDFQVDYIEVASTKDCIPAGPDTRLCEIQHPRVFVAARIENTRLIDNALLVGESL